MRYLCVCGGRWDRGLEAFTLLYYRTLHIVPLCYPTLPSHTHLIVLSFIVLPISYSIYCALVTLPRRTLLLHSPYRSLFIVLFLSYSPYHILLIVLSCIVLSLIVPSFIVPPYYRLFFNALDELVSCPCPPSCD